MKYEVIKLRKEFRYHATVMAMPDKWWEKYLLFKKTSILQFQGTQGMWMDNKFNYAPEKISTLIDIKFAQQFNNPFADFFNLLFGAFKRHFPPPPLPPPSTGNK